MYRIQSCHLTISLSALLAAGAAGHVSDARAANVQVRRPTVAPWPDVPPAAAHGSTPSVAVAAGAPDSSASAGSSMSGSSLRMRAFCTVGNRTII